MGCWKIRRNWFYKWYNYSYGVDLVNRGYVVIAPDIICFEDRKDKTKFNIDKNKGNEFFKEQTGIEEELFCSTIVAEQERVKLDDKEQITLLQKLTNLVSTGSDSVSYKKAEAKLSTKLLDEVGTDRTTENKPRHSNHRA